MSIKYEIHSIKNSHGTGEERNFTYIFEHEPMTAKQLKSHILPNVAMLQEVKSNVRFERADFSSKSSKYTEEEMLEKKTILSYNQSHHQPL